MKNLAINKKNGKLYRVIQKNIDANNGREGRFTFLYEQVDESGVRFTRSEEEFCKKFILVKNNSDAINVLVSLVDEYKDFPREGILYKDLNPIFRIPAARHLAMYLLVETIKKQGWKFDCIVGIESRGFMMGFALAEELGVHFIPARKKNKLPGSKYSKVYDLEYGRDTIQIQKDHVEGLKSAIVFDDLLATGGTSNAVVELLKEAGLNSHVLQLAVLPEVFKKSEHYGKFEVTALLSL